MATSLAEQLQKLSVPQSSVYRDDKKKASLLFNPKDAALKDRDTFYEIGISGLKELIELYEGFRIYEDSLFSIASKELERAVQTKEANEHLDHSIEKFLRQLSPYFLLQSAHKSLEWLVNRYNIHQYNQDAVMALILPYHETKIFVRFIQLMDLKDRSSRWHWLQLLQEPGIPLAKQVLYNHCSSNVATLQFIAKSTVKFVNEFGTRASQLGTVFAFFCSTAIGSIDACKGVTEAIVTSLLSTIMKALESPIDDYRSSAYVVIGYMTTKMKLKEETINGIVAKILNSDYDLTYDMVLLTNIIYSSQEHVDKITHIVLYNISVDRMQTLCVHIRKLMLQNINVMQFVLTFLSSILPLIQTNNEEFRISRRLPEMLVNEVDFKTQSPEKIIRYFLSAFIPSSTSGDGYESDVEIVDEDDHFDSEVAEWYSSVLKSLENKYPEVFDAVLKSVINSKGGISKRRHSQFSKILGFKPSVVHKIGNNYLFENLNHVNPQMRVEAVEYIANEFSLLKAENADFLRESMLSRYNDDNADVVKAMLKIPIHCAGEVLTEEELTKLFVNIISKSLNNRKKWKSVIKEAISVFCCLDILQVNQATILALMPHLFPVDDKSAQTAVSIVKSAWGKNFSITRQAAIELKKTDKNLLDHESICNAVLSAIWKSDNGKLLDVNKLNKNSTLDSCLYLLLKSNSLKNVGIEEHISYLDNILEFVKRGDIEPGSEEGKLCGKHMAECIQFCRQDTIQFQVLEFFLGRLIEDSSVKNVSKPWCNVCKSPEMILVRRLFEMCVVGCSFPHYSESYCKLLQKLLEKFCCNATEKVEFIANFGFGHILYAEKADDIITPALQLRSLRLLNNCIQHYEKVTWLSESNIIVVMILITLSNPLAVIRQSVLEIAASIVQKTPDNSNSVYYHLLKLLLNHKEEMLLDHKQISQVLHTVLTEQGSEHSKMKKCLQIFITIITDTETPAHVSSELLSLLASINNTSILPLTLPVAERLMNIVDKCDIPYLNVYEYKLIQNIFSRINRDTIKSFKDDKVWHVIVTGLRNYKECVMEVDQSLTSPCNILMKQFSEDEFAAMPESRALEFVLLVCEAGTFCERPATVSIAVKLIKRIELNFNHFEYILRSMLLVKDPTVTTLKLKSNMPMLTHHTLETAEWKLGVTILEYVQNKKRLNVDHSFVALLFELLKKCLDFDEQSYVEYTKQLIISSIWFYCKKVVSENNIKKMKPLKSAFDIEVVVQCIRGTQNPQTHHHALILLSHAASLLPDQVLNHTMAIFTFIGGSVLRHDDAYSFQIITKVIETIVPILVKLDKNIEEYSDDEIISLQNHVVPVLRIFADVVLDVPEHRRLPLYKKLIETLGPSQFLWVFVALLLETHIQHWSEDKDKMPKQSRSLAEQESPVNRLDFGHSILLEFSPEIILDNFIKLVMYLKTLPLLKKGNSMDTGIDPRDIFSVSGHSPVQLRHYKYIIITFMNSCLSSPLFIHHINAAEDIPVMETSFKTIIINILTFIQSVSKVKDEVIAKYWRVMLHYSYELLDHVNNLLSAPMFLSVVRGLLRHTLHTMRRKAMELLNSKIQASPDMFANCDPELLHSLLPALVEIVNTINSTDNTLSEAAAQELELNQQTALLSLKLMTRMLAAENPIPFKPIIECITELTCNTEISGNVMASIVLCLAELCGNLKAHALAHLPKFMPALIKVLKKQRKVETPELILLSTITAVSKIVESLPLFLSPYMQKILYEYSILTAKWQKLDQECSKVSAVVGKLANIKRKIATSVAPRVLIPVVSQTYQMHLSKRKLDAVGPIMSVLAESFANITRADFLALQQDLSTFFLSALQLRSDALSKGIDAEVIDQAEDEIVNALVSLVLKLSETSFRPFYYKICDWAIRGNTDNEKDRVITFYRLSSAIAEKLKGLFVLFASYFIVNAAELLDACNTSVTEKLYFESEEKCALLIDYILKTLRVVFLYDSQNFVNTHRFEILMQPIVNQLENTLGGMSALQKRSTEILVPCVSQFAVAIADDSLWKLLNYQVLLKTRHNDAEIRLICLECLVSMASLLGGSWLPLLAESVPFLAELLEDGDPRIENATQDAVRKLEQILGEPLQKYF